MWAVLVLIGILFVEFALLRASHLKNDVIAEDKQQMDALKRKYNQKRSEQDYE